MGSKIFAACILVAAGALAAASWTCGQGDSPGPEAEIRELLKQKRDVLQERYEAVRRLYDLGTVLQERVLVAQRDLLAASVELAESEAGRLEVLQEIVENAQEFERLMAERFENGTVGRDEVQLATVARIDAQIAVLRAKSGP